MIFTALLIGILAAVIFYDFRYRAVPLVVLLFTLIIAFIRLLWINNVRTGLMYAGINLFGCLLLLGMTVLFLFMLKGKLFNPVNRYLGAGDLFFFPVICFSFSPVNFLFFFMFSLMMILILKPIIFRKSHTIPLAGMQAVFLVLLITISGLIRLNLFNDVFLLYHLLY